MDNEYNQCENCMLTKDNVRLRHVTGFRDMSSRLRMLCSECTPIIVRELEGIYEARQRELKEFVTTN